MEDSFKVLINGDACLNDILESQGTSVDDKYYYLPYWFERDDEGRFICHRLSCNFPNDLKRAIEDFREEVKIETDR